MCGEGGTDAGHEIRAVQLVHSSSGAGVHRSHSSGDMSDTLSICESVLAVSSVVGGFSELSEGGIGSLKFRISVSALTPLKITSKDQTKKSDRSMIHSGPELRATERLSRRCWSWNETNASYRRTSRHDFADNLHPTPCRCSLVAHA